MKKRLTLLLTCILICMVCNAQVLLKGSDNKNYTAYTKAQIDLLFTSKTLLSNTKDTAITTAVSQANNYSNEVCTSMGKALRTEIVFLKQKDTVIAGHGMRFDSIAPNKVKAVPQVYWDPASGSYKRNW